MTIGKAMFTTNYTEPHSACESLNGEGHLSIRLGALSLSVVVMRCVLECCIILSIPRSPTLHCLLLHMADPGSFCWSLTLWVISFNFRWLQIERCRIRGWVYESCVWASTKIDTS